MRPIRFSLIFLIGVAALSLAIGYALNGEWIAGGLALLLGALWLALSLAGQWAQAPKLGWLYIAAAVFGILTNLPASLMLLCVVASLCAWDVGEFTRRLSAAGRVEQTEELERRHLLRLLPVALAGLALGAAALVVQISLSFGVAVLLAALAVAALALAARRATAP